MPVRIEYTEDGLGAIFHYEGRMVADELISAIRESYSDDRFLNIKYAIGDTSNCTEFLLNKEKIKELTYINTKESKKNPGVLLALVRPNDIDFGLTRMFKAYSTDDQFVIEIFRDKETAMNWINTTLGLA